MKSVTAYLTLLWAFLLPWQARLILREGAIGGEAWQYGTISVSVAEALLGILFFILLSRSDIRWRRFMPLALFAIVLLWGAWRADDSLLAFSRAILFLVLLFVAYSAPSFANVSVRGIAYAFLFGMLPQALLGVGQFFMQEVPGSAFLGAAAHHASTLGDSVVETSVGRYLRAYGSFPHPNVFGGFLAIAVVLSAWLWAHATRFAPRLFASVSFLVNGAALFFTFSRGAWVATALGLAFLFVSFGWKKAAPAIISAFALASLLGFAAFPLLQTRVAAQGRLEAQSISERVDGVTFAWRVFQEQPFFGAGMGNATLALARAFPGSPIWHYQPPHNAALSAIVEIGLLGFLALIGVMTSLLRGVWNHPLARALVVALAAIGFFDHFLWTLPAGLALAGFVVVSSHLSRQGLDKPPPQCTLGL